MRFVIATLIDITETKEYHKPGLQHQQQANYMTLMQTLGLRSNPYPIKQSQETLQISDRFGSNFQGEHSIWTQILEFDQQDAHSIELMQKDLDLVPVICGLTETVKLNNSVFNTQCLKEKNIVFDIVD